MTTPAPGLIELRLNNVGQLFNTMDPSPFHERDLDHDAEEFILSWAREHEKDSDLRIRIVLRRPEDAESALVLRDLITPGYRLGDFLREGLTICGWVGLWKPIDIHLYRWWPLRAHGRLLTRLSGCPVEVVFEA